jgi:hypothetical protein
MTDRERQSVAEEDMQPEAVHLEIAGLEMDLQRGGRKRAAAAAAEDVHSQVAETHRSLPIGRHLRCMPAEEVG